MLECWLCIKVILRILDGALGPERGADHANHCAPIAIGDGHAGMPDAPLGVQLLGAEGPHPIGKALVEPEAESGVTLDLVRDIKDLGLSSIELFGLTEGGFVETLVRRLASGINLELVKAIEDVELSIKLLGLTERGVDMVNDDIPGTWQVLFVETLVRRLASGTNLDLVRAIKDLELSIELLGLSLRAEPILISLGPSKI